MRFAFQIAIWFGFMIGAMANAANGILVIAHGTSHHSTDHSGDHLTAFEGGHGDTGCEANKPSQWEKSVLKATKQAQKNVQTPVEVAFGMWETKCFDQGIDRLKTRLAENSQTMDHLYIVPLFISDFSSVIEAQKYIFHLRSESPLPEMGIHPSHYRGPLSYGHSIGYNQLISKILIDRTKSLLEMATKRGFAFAQTELVMVMHGPVEDDANLKWLEMGRSYTHDIMKDLNLSVSHVVSLRDDAEPEVRDRATAQLLAAVDDARARGRIALVLPLLLSKGGIEAGIALRLKGHDAIWSGQALFPDVRMESWLHQQFETIPTPSSEPQTKITVN